MEPEKDYGKEEDLLSFHLVFTHRLSSVGMNSLHEKNKKEERTCVLSLFTQTLRDRENPTEERNKERKKEKKRLTEKEIERSLKKQVVEERRGR